MQKPVVGTIVGTFTAATGLLVFRVPWHARSVGCFHNEPIQTTLPIWLRPSTHVDPTNSTTYLDYSGATLDWLTLGWQLGLIAAMGGLLALVLHVRGRRRLDVA